MIPRSSSVVVKRVPPARPGKGKAAMYVASPGTSATPDSRSNGQAGSTSWGGKGSMSRRFDRESSSKQPASVRVVRPFLLALTHTHIKQAPLPNLTGNQDEAAAMAAMFQAQSANWEETQEKMSQLVSPLALLPVSCSNFSNTQLCPFYRGLFVLLPFPPFSVRPGSIRTHVGRVSVAGASRLCHITSRARGRFRPVTCAIVAARKVCKHVLAPLNRACA